MEVRNETELLTAIENEEQTINIIDSFEVNQQFDITSYIKIDGGTELHEIKKSNEYCGAIFKIYDDAALELSNVVLDGNREEHSLEEDNNKSLIILDGGSLMLYNNIVLRNNVTNGNGGGICTVGNHSSGNRITAHTFDENENIHIENCEAAGNGGAIYFPIYNKHDDIMLFGAIIENNKAVSGGGIFIESFFNDYIEEEMINPIRFECGIGNNIACSNGGGIYVCNHYAKEEMLARVYLGYSNIYNNEAANGSAIYCENYNLDISETRIEHNIAKISGTLYFNAKDSNLELNLIGIVIHNNKAQVGGAIYHTSNSGGIVNLYGGNIRYNRSYEYDEFGYELSSNIYLDNDSEKTFNLYVWDRSRIEEIKYTNTSKNSVITIMEPET